MNPENHPQIPTSLVETDSAVPVSRAPSIGTPNPGETLGIISAVTSFFGGGLLSLILGIVGIKKSKAVGMSNPAAIIGVVVGSIGILIGTAFVIYTMTYVVTTFN